MKLPVSVPLNLEIDSNLDLIIVLSLLRPEMGLSYSDPDYLNLNQWKGLFLDTFTL